MTDFPATFSVPTLFVDIQKDVFLKEYWQKKTYVFREVLLDLASDIVESINGNELAGLACEDEVESRIIFGHDQLGEWRCEQGVFDEKRFATLPEKNWTLLVQGIDQWFEEVQDIYAYFNFLPQWRLEDVMASYAPLGGGVGPHFDYYDVFLIQVSGSREWRLGQQCDDESELQNNNQVKLLQHFFTEETHVLAAGDILYVPAGKAHWGIATTDDCVTFSVGFRAPSEKELLTVILEDIVEQCCENKRYKDSLLSIDDHSAKINVSAHAQLTPLLANLTPEKIQRAAQQALGSLVTESRYMSSQENDAENSLEQWVAITKKMIEKKQVIELCIPLHTRLAFSDTQLFVNGEVFDVEEAFAQAVCDGIVPVVLMGEEEIDIMAGLFFQGFIEIS